MQPPAGCPRPHARLASGAWVPRLGRAYVLPMAPPHLVPLPTSRSTWIEPHQKIAAQVIRQAALDCVAADVPESLRADALAFIDSPALDAWADVAGLDGAVLRGRLRQWLARGTAACAAIRARDVRP